MTNIWQIEIFNFNSCKINIPKVNVTLVSSYVLDFKIAMYILIKKYQTNF